MKWFQRKDNIPAAPRKTSNIFSTHIPMPEKLTGFTKAIVDKFASVPVPVVNYDGSAIAMDSGYNTALKSQYGAFNNEVVPENLAYWYGSQSFIGYQLCAMFAQNWLVDKACTMPARDAIRAGYDISIPEGLEVPPEKLAALKEMDAKMGIMDKMVEFVRFGRIFGIRVALFEVESTDPEYYLKPFNIDGVTPGSYKGICQIDPYWITPELDFEAASNPASLHFYEPTWWRVNGQRIHRSHFAIMVTNEVADILKPSYFYGGVSIPQKVYERVYAAERTANEAPLLAMSKRTTAIKSDLTLAEANKDKFLETISVFANFRDNFGVKLIGLDDEMQQFDTSLADLDAAIMTQYQLVSAASEVPSTKLLGTAPKGFNATGEYDESSYHEMLESIQEHDLTPMLERHHALCIKSEISPAAPFPVKVTWNPLDSPTALELADINLKKAQTGASLTASGAIDGLDERQRVMLDKDSGYASLPDIERDIDELEGNDENETEDPKDNE